MCMSTDNMQACSAALDPLWHDGDDRAIENGDDVGFGGFGLEAEGEGEGEERTGLVSDGSWVGKQVPQPLQSVAQFWQMTVRK